MNHIVLMVFPDGISRIGATKNIDAYFEKAFQRHGIFLPVAAFECDIDAFMEASHILRLPKTSTTQWAADLLHRAPVSPSAQRAVIRMVKRLNGEASGLFNDWLRAVVKAKEVAV